MTEGNTSAITKSIIARSLVDGDVRANLSNWLRDLEARGYLTKQDSLIVSRVNHRDLVKLASFVTKIQNNFLWDHFPLSRALMRDSGLELEFFVKYSDQHHVLRRNKHSINERVRAFVAFLIRYCEQRRDDQRLWILLQIVKHESVLRAIATNYGEGRYGIMASPSDFSDGPYFRPFVTRDFRIDGQFLLLETEFDQFEYLQRYGTRCPNTSECVARKTAHIYWSSDKGIRIFKIDLALSLAIAKRLSFCAQESADKTDAGKRRQLSIDNKLNDLIIGSLRRFGVFAPSKKSRKRQKER